MSHLEKLNARYNQIQGLLNTIEAAAREVSAEARKKQQVVLEKYFTAEEGDVVECSHASVSVRKEGADKFNSFFDMYVNDSWNDDDSKEFLNLYLSHSSFRTEEVAEWVVERFEKQAHYSRIAVDFQDDILAEFNQISEEAHQLALGIYLPAKDLRKESKELHEEIRAIKKEARQKALMSQEGLEIKGNEVERWGRTVTEFPDLQVKFDWTIRNIRGLRINKMSASGKSADITVKVKRESWDPSSDKWSEKIVEEKVDRVRMENIEHFLMRNKIEI